jgi:hypothetical protein
MFWLEPDVLQPLYDHHQCIDNGHIVAETCLAVTRTLWKKVSWKINTC